PGIFRLLVFPDRAMRHSPELWGDEMPVSANRPVDGLQKRAGQRKTRDVLKAMLTATAIRTGIVAVMVGLPTTGARAYCALDGDTVTCDTPDTEGYFGTIYEPGLDLTINISADVNVTNGTAF